MHLPRAHSRWPLLLTTFRLALTFTLATTATRAQEQTARLIKDANRDSIDLASDLQWVSPAGPRNVVFGSTTLDHGYELWTSDGTPAGTHLLKDIWPGVTGSRPRGALSFGTGANIRTAFVCSHPAGVGDLWVTDGTEQGTIRLYRMSDGPEQDEQELEIVAATPNGFFFLHLEDGSHYGNIVYSDGTPEGTGHLNPREGNTWARIFWPSNFVTSGSQCCFIGNDNQIWRSDGTNDGTKKVATITTGTPNHLALAGEQWFASVQISAEIAELWTGSINGAPPTRLGPPQGTTWLAIEELISSGDRASFVVRAEDETGTESRVLYSSDGTAAGTQPLHPMTPRSLGEAYLVRELKTWQGDTYFTALSDDTKSFELWRTDGTPTGTTRVSSFPDPHFDVPWGNLPDSVLLTPTGMPQDSEFLYFAAWSISRGQWDLWRTRGDAATTRRVRGAPEISPYDGWGPSFASAQSSIFFPGNPWTPQASLWRSRGKAASAVQLTTPETEGATSLPYTEFATPYETLGTTLLKLVNTGRSHELWRMNPDGTRARSIWEAPVPLTSSLGSLEFRGKLADRALFAFSDGNGIVQLWSTDGTRPGTTLVADHSLGTNRTALYNFVTLNGAIYYAMIGGPTFLTDSLWRTDGTALGTTKIVAANGSPFFPKEGEMITFGGNLYFLATNERRVTTLWKSDGTDAGTVLLKEGPFENERDVWGLSTAGGSLYFIAPTYTSSLWRSDGTAAGTTKVDSYVNFKVSTPVMDFGGLIMLRAENPLYAQGLRWYRPNSSGFELVGSPVAGQNPLTGGVLLGNKVFYTGVDSKDVELWSTDGTTIGTRRVKDINPGLAASSSPFHMLVVGKMIYFTADDTTHGRELWRTDGTEAGTVLVADIQPGHTSSSPGDLKAANGKLYFSAYRRDVGRELFVIDLPAE